MSTASAWSSPTPPVRLHGDVKIYTSGYSDRALAGWARRMPALDWLGEG